MTTRTPASTPMSVIVLAKGHQHLIKSWKGFDGITAALFNGHGEGRRIVLGVVLTDGNRDFQILISTFDYKGHDKPLNFVGVIANGSVFAEVRGTLYPGAGGVFRLVD